MIDKYNEQKKLKKEGDIKLEDATQEKKDKKINLITRPKEFPINN